MRFSSSVVLALPLLAAAEGAFEQYKAQFQNFLGSFGATGQNARKEAEGYASVPKPQEDTITFLTLDNWKHTLYAPVKPGSTTPEEWWVLITGGNKSCFGQCLTVQAAFNETAVKVAKLPKPIRMAYVDCENERVLCNSWSAGPNSLWVFEMLPPPAKTDIWVKRLNSTTTTYQTILELQTQGHKDNFHLHDGYFHPLDGPLARNGLSLAAGYFFYFFNVVPSWVMMLGISFLSRSMMNRRMNARENQARARAPGAAPAGAARG